MAGWDGTGNFTLPYSWVQDASNNIDISSSRMDTQESTISSQGFGNCLTRDGQGIATANLPMGTFRHTGVGNAAALTDYAAAGQIRSNAILFAVGAGTGDAIAATLSPASTTLTDGMQVSIRAPGTNTVTTPTFAPNGLTAHNIVKYGGQALSAGDIQNTQELLLRYVLASTWWELLNPNVASSSVSLAGNNTWTGVQVFGVPGAVARITIAGNTSGGTTLYAPATGGGAATFFSGTDTVAGLAAAQALTNKSYNGMTVSASTGTFTLTNAKTFSVANTLTLTATDGSTLAIGGGGTLGTAAYQATGTSGANIPFLNGTNTWSGVQTFSSATTMSAALTYGGVALSNSVTGTGSMALSASPTFTGTLTAANLTTTGTNTFSKQINGPSSTLTDGANIAWDVSTKQAATVTLAGNRTLSNQTNAVAGGVYIVTVTQGAGGSHTLAYGTNYKFPGGVAPVLSTAAAAVDVLTFFSPNGTLMYGVIQQAFS